MSMAESGPSELLPVDELAAGRFLVIDELHRRQDASRIVYDTLDTITGIHTALKITRVKRGAPLDTRTQREYDFSANFIHANVASSIGSGRLLENDHEQVYYLAVPKANQGDITRFRVTDRQSAVQIWSYFLDAARGLQAMHDSGFVHGDVKPHNILVHSDRAKISDFGCVMVPGSEADAFVKGDQFTIGYASPEQMEAQSQIDIDHRTDIFSWAVSALYALNNAHPYIRDGRGKIPIAIAVLNENMYVPFKKYIPRDVYRLLLQCMSSDPSVRPANFGEVIDSAQAMFSKGYKDKQLPMSQFEINKRRKTIESRRASVVGGLISIANRLSVASPHGLASIVYRQVLEHPDLREIPVGDTDNYWVIEELKKPPLGPIDDWRDEVVEVEPSDLVQSWKIDVDTPWKSEDSLAIQNIENPLDEMTMDLGLTIDDEDIG